MFPIVILNITDDDDREFMKQVYIDFYNIMRREIYRVLSRTDILDDIIQDACVKLIEKIQTLRKLDCCRLHAYVVFTVRNTTKDFIKHSDVQRKHTYLGFEDDAKEVISNTVADDAGSPEQTIIHEENIKRLRTILPMLPEQDKLILKCKYILDMEDKDIAELMNIKASSVRQYLTRARRKALAFLQEGGITNVT